MKLLNVFLTLCALLSLSACATQNIIRDSEYENSQAAFKGGQPQYALDAFPVKEEAGFVTSTEKAWLGLWADQDHSKNLREQTKTLDSRKFTSVSKEAEYFFYSESEDGYIPAEHEIIVMHLLSSMYFLRTAEWSAARVEAKKAAFYLQSYFPENQAHFDDSALRIWLAGIWAALGEWQEAQVDLRKAYELSQNKSLLPLLDMQQAPQDFSVIFDGTGPTVNWRSDTRVPAFSDESVKPTTDIHFSTLPWFLRHGARDTAIRDVVMKSNYMAQYYGLNTKVGATKAFGFITSSALRITGVILGTVIVVGGIAIAMQGQSSPEVAGQAVKAGIVTGGFLWSTGDDVSDGVQKSAEKMKASGSEELKSFRFVRFMPSWISLSVAAPTLAAHDKVQTYQAANSKTKVQFIQRF